jgi:putative transposase
MPRRPREEEPGAYYHVTSRGNNKQAVFLDDRDHLDFTFRLEYVAADCGWVVLAHCQMTNHYHFVVQIRDGGLSQGMSVLNGRFSQRANARHGREGHLFQSRYRAARIESDAHLLEACRYVVLNPVRARLCARPEQWRWSSYRASVGLDFAPSFLALDQLLRFFGPRPTTARAAYRAFVRDGHVQVPGTGNGTVTPHLGE